MISLRLSDAPPLLATLHAEHLARARRVRAAACQARLALTPPTRPLPPAPPVELPEADALVIRPKSRESAARAVAAYADPGRTNIRTILIAVSGYYGVPTQLILGRTRREGIVHPRHVAVYLARKLTPLSFPQIGLRFGRDHTTILHAFCKIDGLRACGDETVLAELCDILGALGVAP